MTLVEQKNPFDIGMKDEIPRWYNPRTGKLEPINPPESPWTMGGANTMEWNYERDGQNPLAGFGPIGAYNPDTDESKVVPLDFLNNFLDERLLAKGKSPFSTPYWDKQDDIRKYLENIRRLKERGLLGGLPKV